MWIRSEGISGEKEKCVDEIRAQYLQRALDRRHVFVYIADTLFPFNVNKTDKKESVGKYSYCLKTNIIENYLFERIKMFSKW